MASRSLCLLILLAACGREESASPRGRSAPAREAPVARLRLTEARHYYDGGRKCTCWLNPELVVDFSGGEAPPGGEEILKTPAVRVYRVQDMPGGRFVRVYHNGPSDRGTMRAPTGRIIVKFKPDWTAARIEAWVRQERLDDARKLDFGDHFYRFRVTGDALARANAYHESGLFAWVSPDWWKSASRR